ncbi:unnamed protein product [Chondrus crispus]|uniref:Uncharacterized protein n=1 Tax=Chondrus crispus TaxID=2769 RepID=R7QSH5_CHOCR|nr:unnamed protein product [Chondrus crispus]CDF41069.1 unnamed protein product [Chondrus crispus]|eukprot:XP_005711363.1 unnamed protein product [Chondrus crispus]
MTIVANAISYRQISRGKCHAWTGYVKSVIGLTLAWDMVSTTVGHCRGRGVMRARLRAHTCDVISLVDSVTRKAVERQPHKVRWPQMASDGLRWPQMASDEVICRPHSVVQTTINIPFTRYIFPKKMAASYLATPDLI